jgi:beta-galactosidase
VDIVNAASDYAPYRILVAPMLYMVSAETAADRRLRSRRGTFVTTYWSGIVDENDLCHLGGFPGPLREVLGIWAEEIDALYPDETRHLAMSDGNALGFEGTYSVRELWGKRARGGSRGAGPFPGRYVRGAERAYGERVRRGEGVLPGFPQRGILPGRVLRRPLQGSRRPLGVARRRAARARASP